MLFTRKIHLPGEMGGRIIFISIFNRDTYIKRFYFKEKFYGPTEFIYNRKYHYGNMIKDEIQGYINDHWNKKYFLNGKITIKIKKIYPLK